MTAYMRNWIRFCSIGFAVIAFVWINFDLTPNPMSGTPPRSFGPGFIERQAELLALIPLAFLGGALWGAVIGAFILVVRDGARWVGSWFYPPGG